MSRGAVRAMVLLLATAACSGAIGFALVWGSGRLVGPPPRPVQDAVAAADAGAGGTVGPGAGAAASLPSADGGAADEQLRDEVDAPPDVPPGPTPDGVALDGAPLYFKCWAADGTLHRRRECGRLELFERRFTTRLYVVDRCKRKVAGADATGKLSLGIALDFADGSIGYWSGPSTEIPGGQQIATCLRDELAGLPLYGIKSKMERYRLFQTVIFGIAEVTGRSRPLAGDVEVTMDRVRVREQPVDGRIIGRLRAGSRVTLLEKKHGWCRIVTPASRVGWLTCEALAD